MKWKDVNETHNGRRAIVSATSTPENPLRGSGPFVGYIECKRPGNVPILHVGSELHSFAWYWEVKFIKT